MFWRDNRSSYNSDSLVTEDEAFSSVLEILGPLSNSIKLIGNSCSYNLLFTREANLAGSEVDQLFPDMTPPEMPIESSWNRPVKDIVDSLFSDESLDKDSTFYRVLGVSSPDTPAASLN